MQAQPVARHFRRTNRSDAWIAGVCGGLAQYFHLDPLLVRVLWIVLTVASLGLSLIAYLLLWALAPKED